LVVLQSLSPASFSVKDKVLRMLVVGLYFEAMAGLHLRSFRRVCFRSDLTTI
jgi:hypothetical protein